SRKDNLQDSWVYTASLAGQETKGTVKAILVPLSVWLLQGSKFDSVPRAAAQPMHFEVPIMHSPRLCEVQG
ncbi:MAG TPA: hypothetical protein VMV35_04885, partial [Halothiobacillus sp.]|nr:hypothetical protein [Halothiobacillus sp.]